MMKNVCRRKRAMRERSGHWWLWFLLVVVFIAGPAVDARAEYSRDNAAIPTDADLVMMQSRSKTLVIRLLNLTPYDVVEDPAHISKMSGATDTDRNTAKTGMFAPLGWPGGPNALRGLVGDPPNNGWTQIPETGNWLFTPNATNTSTHPYNFVVAWNDHGGHVTKSEIGWIIKGVYAAGHGPVTKDVPLRMWFTRNDSSKPLNSDLFGFITSCVKEAVKLIGCIVMPENPAAWINAYAGIKELANSAFENFNGVDTSTDADKMYFAAYVVPDGKVGNPDCIGCEPQTVTQSSDGTTDGVDVEWAPETGPYSEGIIVTTHLLRGKDNGPDYPSNYSGFHDYRVPIVHVTLWTPEQYTHSQLKSVAKMTSHYLGAQLDAALATGDLQKYKQFASIYKSLNKSQRETLREAIKAFLREDPLTRQEVVLVEKIIAAMQKGQIKLSPANR
jgi:hypothetical protein